MPPGPGFCLLACLLLKIVQILISDSGFCLDAGLFFAQLKNCKK
jgi:hypothetical protein